MKDAPTRFASGELFAGADGLAFGCQMMGFESVATLERDRWACDTIRENKQRGHELVEARNVCEGDVRDFDWSVVTDDVDHVTGGPPRSLDTPAKAHAPDCLGAVGGENLLRHVDGSIRYFTVRESARLQTFPDDYELHGSWGEAMRQLGNAVPVLLGQVVAESVHNALIKEGIN